MRRPLTIGALALLAAACQRGSGGDGGEAHGHGAVPAPATTPDVPDIRPFLEGVSYAPYAGLEEGEPPAGFFVAARVPHLERHPCAECHAGVEPKAPPPAGAPEPTRRAHWDVERPHGKAAGLSCATCHDLAREAALRDVHGRPVDFDQSYRVCARCHFEQHRDWVGGAHGKRLGGWGAPRVIQSCAGCHDPHAPAFPTRRPATHPRMPVH